MRLWTVQPIEVYDNILKYGEYKCAPAKAELLSYKEFKKAYKWLSEKMNEKKLAPTNVFYPVWAWHTRDWKHKKPDLRNIGLGIKREKSVCLEIEIPDDEVFLTDFDAWHFILNDTFVPKSENEKDWEIEWDLYDKMNPEEKEKYKLNSWNEVFNISPFENDWMTRGKYIQATFWKLKKENIVKVQFFTAR